MALPPPDAGRFVLGAKSLKVLSTVDGELQRVVRRAITITEVDFSVFEGMRTADKQLKAWRDGASQLNGIPVGQIKNGVPGTGVGNHQSGRAVDLVAYIGGHSVWEPWSLYYAIADAMQKASEYEKVPLVWGGSWGVLMSAYDAPPRAMSERYVSERRKRGKRAFIDGPHFELA